MNDEFDYEHPDPESLKEWEAEQQRALKREMQFYLKQFPDATPEEKRALRRWVNSGRSPYENGDYVVNDDGGPMDFIHALRFLEDEYQEYLKDPEGYREMRSGDHSPAIAYYDPETGEEYPF